MPAERGQQFPDDKDFLAQHGFSEDEQITAGYKAMFDTVQDEKTSQAMLHYGQKIMGANSPEGQAERVEASKTELAVHGYHPKQVEHILSDEGQIHPTAVHHYGDFSAHWEPGHDSMFVYHKSQDRLLDADPVGSIPVGHLHTEDAHIPTVNQDALAKWHSNPENIEKAMGKLNREQG
jgi:hypothetical protein